MLRDVHPSVAGRVTEEAPAPPCTGAFLLASFLGWLVVLNRSKKRCGLLQLFRELDPRASKFGEMISLLWCACAFGEMHTIESVLTTLFGVAWHPILRYATPFPVAEAELIPKVEIFVNAAVVAPQQEVRTALPRPVGVETGMGPSRLGKGLDGDMEAQHA